MIEKRANLNSVNITFIEINISQGTTKYNAITNKIYRTNIWLILSCRPIVFLDRQLLDS